MSAIQLRLHGATAPRSHRPAGRWVAGLFGRAVATVREWQQRNRERQALAGFDERLLRDIGLTPAEAEFLINKPFWRK